MELSPSTPPNWRDAIALFLLIPGGVASFALDALLFGGWILHGEFGVDVGRPPREFYVGLIGLEGAFLIAVAVQGTAIVGSSRKGADYESAWVLMAAGFAGMVAGVSVGITAAFFGLLGADPYGVSSTPAVMALVIAAGWLGGMPFWANLTPRDAEAISQALDKWLIRLRLRSSGQ